MISARASCSVEARKRDGKLVRLQKVMLLIWETKGGNPYGNLISEHDQITQGGTS